MREHGGIPSQGDKYVTLAAISPPGLAHGRFVGGHQSGLAGCKSPPLFKRGAPSCSSQRQRQREPLGACPGPSAPTYLLTFKGAGVEHLKLLKYFPFPHLYFSFYLAFGESDYPFYCFYPTNIYVN